MLNILLIWLLIIIIWFVLFIIFLFILDIFEHLFFKHLTLYHLESTKFFWAILLMIDFDVLALIKQLEEILTFVIELLVDPPLALESFDLFFPNKLDQLFRIFKCEHRSLLINSLFLQQSVSRDDVYLKCSQIV